MTHDRQKDTDRAIKLLEEATGELDYKNIEQTLKLLHEAFFVASHHRK